MPAILLRSAAHRMDRFLPDPVMLNEVQGAGDAVSTARILNSCGAGSGGWQRLWCGSTLPTADDIPWNVKAAIAQTVKESNSRNNDVGDTRGGFHETGGLAAPAASGHPDSSVYLDVIPVVPGKAADPRVERGHAEIGLAPVDPSSVQSNPRIAWQVHPRRVIGDCEREGCSVFNQPRSDEDKLNAKPGEIHLVVGARSNRVYIYNNKGAVSTYTWKQFMTPNYLKDTVFP
jgi:hypothetical protein